MPPPARRASSSLPNGHGWCSYRHPDMQDSLFNPPAQLRHLARHDACGMGAELVVFQHLAIGPLEDMAPDGAEIFDSVATCRQPVGLTIPKRISELLDSDR